MRNISLRIKVLCATFLFPLCVLSRAQFTDGTSGLMQMPTADMEREGTFMITNNVLNKHMLYPTCWDYNTFAYSVNINLWSRIEIAYICTIIDGKRMKNPSDPERAKIMFNQDRHFSAKVQLLKEGEIWSWTPSVAAGISDLLSATDGLNGTYYRVQTEEGGGSGYFNRFYVVVSKHFNTDWGTFSSHLGYQWNNRYYLRYNGVAAAVDWDPIWLQNRWFNPKFILEYDARTLNIGFIASIWDDRFESMFELQSFRWITFGLRYKLALRN